MGCLCHSLLLGTRAETGSKGPTAAWPDAGRTAARVRVVLGTTRGLTLTQLPLSCAPCRFSASPTSGCSGSKAPTISTPSSLCTVQSIQPAGPKTTELHPLHGNRAQRKRAPNPAGRAGSDIYRKSSQVGKGLGRAEDGPLGNLSPALRPCPLPPAPNLACSC